MTADSNSRNTKRYFFSCLLCLLTLSLSLIGLNATVDPLRIYGLLDKPGFNHYKPDYDTYAHIAKPLQLQHRAYDRVALGTSRVLNGIPMYGSAWDDYGQTAFNAGMNGAGIFTLLAYLEHMIASGHPPAELLVGTDLISFNGLPASKSRYLLGYSQETETEKLQRLNEGYMQSLFSPQIISASIRTLRKQREKDNKNLPSGQKNNALLEQKLIEQGYEAAFVKFENAQAREAWSPCRDNAFAYQGPELDSLQTLSQLLELALAHNIRVTLFMSPVHVRLLETMDASGMTPYWQQWKRDMAALVDTLNRRHQLAPARQIRLWDFQGYHPFTTEMVPQQTGKAMHWHLDASHFHERLGYRMLEKMYGKEVEDGFGLLLTPANVEGRITETATWQKAWREANPALWQDIRQRAAESLELKKHNGLLCTKTPEPLANR